MHSKIGIRSTAIVAAAALLLGGPKPARADHPAIDAAIIVAGAATIVGAAILGAGALIAVAIILDDDSEDEGDCDCPETRTEGEGAGGGGEGGGGGGEAGGGEQGSGQKTMRPPALVFQSHGASVSGSALRPASTTFDDSTTHPGVTSFIDRKGELRVDRTGNGHAAGVVAYQFDGDIRRAPQNVHKFTHDEAMRFDVKVDTRTIQDPRACTAITLRNLRLSTEDIPRTDGSAKLTIDVFEHDVKTSSRELLVQKGLVPQRPAWATGPGWIFAKDRIDIVNAALAVPCTPDPTGMPTSLKLVLSMQFIGARD